MDEHTEARFTPPFHPGVALRWGFSFLKGTNGLVPVVMFASFRLGE
jgi:hypothetical protein